MLNFFSIHNIAFTVYQYPVSYLELTGTIFNFVSVGLASQNKSAAWPIGNIGVLLFGILFYHIHIYGELIKQSYYFILGFYGWRQWTRHKNPSQKQNKSISSRSLKVNLLSLVSILLLVPLLGFAVSRIHEYFPYFFPHQAAYPYWDALLVLMSFSAMLLMAHRKIECWYCFIIVNLLSIGLYAYCGIVLAAFLYAVLLLIAARGLLKWRQELKAQVKLRILTK